MFPIDKLVLIESKKKKQKINQIQKNNTIKNQKRDIKQE